jgi:hypothetical protein
MVLINILMLLELVQLLCARYGCFVPTSIIDFQKGERQMNMDLTLCKALNRMNGIPKVVVLYDIACQYSINSHHHVSQSPFLTLPPTLKIVWDIGLFHIHAHQDACMPRYSPNYIAGVGQVDGKIVVLIEQSQR